MPEMTRHPGHLTGLSGYWPEVSLTHARLKMNTSSDDLSNRLALTPAEAGFLLFGWSSHTVTNRLYAGTFPLPIVKIGDKKVVTMSAIRAALETEQSPQPAQPAARKRGPGRPRKNEVRS